MGNEVPARASVVVIGGGCMGVATAYELAAAGVEDVVLLERGQLGEGSTCKAAGGVRAQFSDEINIRLGAHSLEVFENFEQRFDQVIDLHQVGYLFLLDSPEAVAQFENNARLQRDQGLRSDIISPEEARRLSPYISTEGLLAAAWTPRDGHCSPESVIGGYARAAWKAGATLCTGTPATGIEVDAGHITAVHTPAGTIATDTVINTAGPWARQVGQWAGVDLPVVPLRRQLVITEPIPDRPPNTPFTIDQATTLYFHNEGRGLLIGMSYAGETPGFKLSESDEWLESLYGAIERRIPSVADVGMASGWAGLYEDTPDHNALIGESAQVSRFLYATGFSGHGFLQSPAVGEVMRDLALGRTPLVDVTEFSTERFRGAQLRPEFNIV